MAKCLCVTKCPFNGRVWDVGDVAEVPDDEIDTIPPHFVNLDGTPVRNTPWHERQIKLAGEMSLDRDVPLPAEHERRQLEYERAKSGAVTVKASGSEPTATATDAKARQKPPQEGMSAPDIDAFVRAQRKDRP